MNNFASEFFPSKRLHLFLSRNFRIFFAKCSDFLFREIFSFFFKQIKAKIFAFFRERTKCENAKFLLKRFTHSAGNFTWKLDIFDRMFNYAWIENLQGGEVG